MHLIKTKIILSKKKSKQKQKCIKKKKRYYTNQLFVNIIDHFLETSILFYILDQRTAYIDR